MYEKSPGFFKKALLRIFIPEEEKKSFKIINFAF